MSTRTQTSEPTVQLGEYPEPVAADPAPLDVNVGEMARGLGQMAIPPQQMLHNNTYVMGGVICGKTYKVIMKSLQFRDYFLQVIFVNITLFRIWYPPIS